MTGSGSSPAGEGGDGQMAAPSGSIGRTVARGGAILGFAGVVEQGVQLVRAIILARILTPGDFGLMGMALVATQAAEALSQTGFSRALVQTRKDPRAFLDTAFVVAILRGALLYGLTWLAAPWVALFFGTPEIQPILRVVGTVFVIQGFMNPASFILERELAFGRVALPRALGFVVDMAAAVTIALIMRSVWGMVWGYLIGRTTHVLASYVVRPYLPRLRFETALARELYGYGRHIFRWVSLEYLISQLDRIIVGRLLGADALGLYSFASRIARLPVTGFHQLAFRLGFPVFSHMQGDRNRLKRGLSRSMGVLSAAAAPVSAGLWATGPELVEILLGDQWLGMLPAFRILCLGGVPMALYYLLGTFASGAGRPALAARGSVVYLLTLALPLYPAASIWGLRGVATCVVVASFVGFVVLMERVLRMTSMSPKELLRVLAAPLMGAMGMAAAVKALATWSAIPQGPVLLAAEIGTGILVYSGLLAGLDNLLSGGLLGTLRSLRAGPAGNETGNPKHP